MLLSTHLCGVKEAEAVDQKFITELTLLLYQSGLDTPTRAAINNRISSWQLRLRVMRRNLERAVLHRNVKLRLSIDEIAVSREMSEQAVITVLTVILDWYTVQPYEKRLSFIMAQHNKASVMVECLKMGYEYLTGYYQGMEFIQAVLPVVNLPLELLVIFEETLHNAATNEPIFQHVVSIISGSIRFGIFPVDVRLSEMHEFGLFIEAANLRSRHH